MNLALGHAFNLEEMMYTFNNKRLEITCNECEKLYKTRHREDLVQKVFKECFKQVVTDCIENNVTFELPTSPVKSSIHVKRITGDDFVQARKRGKWGDIDFLKSNFSGNKLVFEHYGAGRTKTKNIYVSGELKQKLTDNTNNGMQYC